MKKSVLEKYRQLAERLGMKCDERSGLIYGGCGGYQMMVYAENDSYPYLLTAAVSAKCALGDISKELSRPFIKEHKYVRGLRQDGFVVKMDMTNMGKGDKLADGVRECLAALASFLRENGFQNCCQTCGEIVSAEPCVLAGSYMLLCNDCFVKLQQSEALRSGEQKKKKENVVGGIVGALIGSLIGVACILIISQLGYVSALSGIVMAVCTLKGYELLGGKLSTAGIIICSLIMLAMIYVGDRLDWAIVIARELDANIMDAFRVVPMLLEEELIEASTYWGSLALLYVFALLGAVPTVISALKNQKQDKGIYRLGVPVEQ